ncbi:MAG TPA: M20/M25/M40 family metallo-hydrolase [Dehalococcoidia bacterium]|nr:M20/M25/M40 family metallo-hydrolase [Dehalococcoidia bacterium]
MPPQIDWQPVFDEALEIFVKYLQIDTSNPPGNEAPAARFLGALLEAEGIDTEYVEIQPYREALFATLKGDGSKRALMLCNHTDVVPVEVDYWTKPAFAGHIEAGKVYGRGAVDMKGCGVMHLITMLLAKRHDITLKRDLVFAAVPDEEAGSVWGMEWLSKNRPDLLDVEFELSEGGAGTTRFAGQEAQLFSVATNEKDICWLKLTSVGTPGHGSRPHYDNSAVTLIKALNKLADWERPVTFTPETRHYVESLQAESLLPAAASDAELEAIITKHPQMHAMFINTLNVTMINSGIKANVIPAKSEATIDCRLLPGQTREDWIDQVNAIIDDDKVSVETSGWDQDQPVAVDWDTELYRTIEAVVTEAMEDAVVVPSTCVGGTDNRFLRQQGIPAYGFIPCLLSPAEAAGFHGNDEHITIENLNMGCELMFEIVMRMSA